VSDDRYFAALVIYIHHNPQKHGFVADFRDWPYSSYHTLVSARPTRLQRDLVLAWFGDVNSFLVAHERDPGEMYNAVDDDTNEGLAGPT